MLVNSKASFRSHNKKTRSRNGIRKKEVDLFGIRHDVDNCNET